MNEKPASTPVRKLLTVALASCLALGAAPAMAQSTGATLRGKVSVDSAPATEAQVTATNLATGLTRTVQTTSSGAYNVAGLPPGTYRIDVRVGGKTSSQNVTLSVGQTATLNLGVGGVAEAATTADATDLEAVIVRAPALVETRTSEVATYVSQRQIEILPQNSRNFLAFADTVPGMQFVVSGNGNESQLRSGAQGASQINVFIDGVGQKNYVTPGGITGQDDSRGNPFPQLAIGEYKVITSNYKAEYDQISSAAVTAVTKSGTNDFTGSFIWDKYTDAWRSPSPAEEVAGRKSPESTTQYGVAFGGPIIRDRLHFFVTYEAKDFVVPDVITRPASSMHAPLPPVITSQYGLTSRPFNQDVYFGKLSFQASDDHLVEFSARVRDEVGILDVGGVNAPSAGTSLTNDETRYDLRSLYSTTNWMNDAHVTFEEAAYNPRPTVNAPINRYTVRNQANSGDIIVLNAGGGSSFQDKGQKGWGVQNDFTFYGWEDHTIKAGFKYKDISLTGFQKFPPNARYIYDAVVNINQPYRIEYTTARVGRDPFVESSNSQFGIYIQDDWQVTDKFMLNLGIRWDYEDMSAYTDYVLDSKIVAALRGWTNIKNTDYNVEDYISNGSNRRSDKNNIAPRIGFSYDLVGDQRHVFFGGIGRSYDRNLFDYMAREYYGGAFTTFTINFPDVNHPCTPSATCIPFNPALLTPEGLAAFAAANPVAGGEVNVLKNDLQTPYSDQLSAGMRNLFELWGQEWSSSVTLAHIRSKEGIYFRLGNRWPDGGFRNPAVPGATWGNQPWGQAIPGYGSLILGQNGIETRLNSLLVGLDKLYTSSSPWGMTIAYTYSDAKENRTNASNGETYVFDYPDVGGEFFLSNGVPKHRLVATGIVGLPWDTTVSSKLTLASPTPRNATNCFNAPSNNNCFYDPYIRDETIGYKQFDIALQKVVDTGSSLSYMVRVDVLNVFDWRNWTDFDDWRGSPGVANPKFGLRSNNGIMWPTRTFKLSFGVNW
ncbi:MAG: TonB-dependent receptor [Xanthomonadales bacterium]|nr:TonB-dependent receptor [Xanthomonadaceae bacterium]MBN8223725.1 TonB-dependent receptor [Xanthomonadales bacterium]MCA0198174.1 TonB-dependent receptor [Pseudomonadota bacterium]